MTTGGATTEVGRPSSLAPLRVRDFRLLFVGFVLGQSMMPLQFVTQIFWVQTHADPDIRLVLIGLIGTMRGAGMLTFGLLVGALADRFDRRLVLLTTQTALFLFSTYVSSGTAVVLGLTFIVGRALYARAYVADPAKRGPGFALSFLSNLVLLVGGLVGALLAWL